MVGEIEAEKLNYKLMFNQGTNDELCTSAPLLQNPLLYAAILPFDYQTVIKVLKISLKKYCNIK